MTPDFDVIVIGAGTAGIAAAITCKLKGLSVLIVSPSAKDSIPTYESVHSGILSLLERIHCKDCLYSAIVGEYDGIESGGRYFDLGSDQGGQFKGYHIDKIFFQNNLHWRARNFDIPFWTNEKVADLKLEDDCVVGVSTFSGKILYSKYVVDASGYNSFAGRKLKLAKECFSPPLISWTGVCNNIIHNHSIFQDNRPKFIPNKTGWSWIAPIPPTKCYWTQLSSKTSIPLRAPDWLGELFGDKKIKKSNRRWSIFRPVSKLGIVLCGDAAGVLDPAAGQGLLFALYSGIKSGEAVYECLIKSEGEAKLLMEYDNWFYQLYLSKIAALSSYYAIHNINFADSNESL